MVSEERVMSKKISIIIPVWNGEKFLAETIESALNQDYEEKEVVVVDDRSTDRSQEVISQFGNQIRSIFSQENRGLGATRNRGVQIASGTHLAFLDQDDLWGKMKLTLQMREYLASEKEDPLVFSYAEQFVCPSLSAEERKKIAIKQQTLPGYIAGTLLVSKKRFTQIGYFFEEKMIGEFIEWYLRALELKVAIKMVNEVLFHRRIHQSNMGRQTNLFNRSDYLKVLKASMDRRQLLNRAINGSPIL